MTDAAAHTDQPPADEPILRVRGLGKSFGGIAALTAVDLDLMPGEVHGLVGENGAGKSTLVKVVTGVHAADSGEILYRGEPIRFAHPMDAQAAGISTIYQEINLIPLISVARNVFLGREPKNRFGLIDARRMNAEATTLLRDVGVEVDVTRPLRALATGIQQMVAIARAISTDARVVVMDEPTSSLEPREVATLFDVVRTLTARGIAVIYISHKMDELYRICRRVTVLRDGRLVHTGPVTELTRLQLVSLMLGRDIAEVRRSGMTAFDAETHVDADAQPVLQASDLSSRHVLDGVSVSVRPGEVLGLGGLLGAGRSETVRGIAGALKLDRGTVHVDGRPLHTGSERAAIRLGISLLTEDRKADGIVPNLSVRENIVLAALPKLSTAGLVSERRQRAVVETFMKRLRIKAASMEQPVSQLSGGNQQKVLLARWLAMSPKVLLLDEPTRGIDVGAKAEVQALVAELAAEGLGVILISSETEELIEGSDRIVALREGMVIGELRGDDVTEPALLSLLSGDEEVLGDGAIGDDAIGDDGEIGHDGAPGDDSAPPRSDDSAVSVTKAAPSMAGADRDGVRPTPEGT